MRLASSWMVIASGIVTSRTSFSFGSPLAVLGAAPLAAAEGGLRALTDLVGGQRGDQRQPAARLFNAGAGRPRRGHRADDAAGAAAEARCLLLVSLEYGSRAGRPCSRCGSGFGFAETLLGDLVGLALGFLVVLAALFLVALAGLGGVAFGLLARLAHRAQPRLLLGDLALLGLAQPCIAERVGAAVTLLLGQRAQHDARRSRRGRGRRCGCRRRASGRGGSTGWRSAPRHRSRRRDRDRSRFRLGIAADRPPLLDLDDHLLAAAMAEALAHRAGLGARLKRKRRLRGHAQRLVARGLGLNHSGSIPVNSRHGPCRFRPDRRSESAQGADNAPKTYRWQGRQAGLHVPHLTGLMPNPIAPPKAA